MAAIASIVETNHRDVVHDAEMNFCGSRLATCASDHIIKVFEVKPTGQTHTMAELSGHEGPVWQVSWSYPFSDKGEYLASCSHDRKVFIWKEVANKWTRIYEYTQHEASINSVAWAPHNYGLIFACGSTDCTISIVTNYDDIWKPAKIFNAHEQGVNAVSWAPAKGSRTVINVNEIIMPKRVVSGGNDKMVKVWREVSEDKWELDTELAGHTDWVRDVAWAPVESHNHFTIASCGSDGMVIIWRTDNIGAKTWKRTVLCNVEAPVYNVSWNSNGTVLAVAFSDNRVALYQERTQNNWVAITETGMEN
ncbi:unnamed protein product [Bursaphelenchus okinawaensis]|uniref:Protein SEC13 homolog n=1 Tax=Bursaphelenchus okinawaensis TaxID=465554 RepID=A0A811L0B2_9BILA|nr:unnamed protein product [Bursaphelenchus okinawaensis]CAG9114752.1 unnamed protein product [Bursaphelenchus okinawaensis]